MDISLENSDKPILQDKTEFRTEFFHRLISAGALDELSIDILFERQASEFSNKHGFRAYRTYQEVIENINKAQLASCGVQIVEQRHPLTGAKWYSVRSDLFPISRIASKKLLGKSTKDKALHSETLGFLTFFAANDFYLQTNTTDLFDNEAEWFSFPTGGGESFLVEENKDAESNEKSAVERKKGETRFSAGPDVLRFRRRVVVFLLESGYLEVSPNRKYLMASSKFLVEGKFFKKPGEKQKNCVVCKKEVLYSVQCDVEGCQTEAHEFCLTRMEKVAGNSLVCAAKEKYSQPLLERLKSGDLEKEHPFEYKRKRGAFFLLTN